MIDWLLTATRTPENTIPSATAPRSDIKTASPTREPEVVTEKSLQRPLATAPAPKLTEPLTSAPLRSVVVDELSTISPPSIELSATSDAPTATRTLNWRERSS